MDDLVFFYIAYSIIWGDLFVYALMMHMGQRQMKKELEALKEMQKMKKSEQ